MREGVYTEGLSREPPAKPAAGAVNPLLSHSRLRGERRLALPPYHPRTASQEALLPPVLINPDLREAALCPRGLGTLEGL